MIRFILISHESIDYTIVYCVLAHALLCYDNTKMLTNRFNRFICNQVTRDDRSIIFDRSTIVDRSTINE